jgi:hypothetical protein
MSSSNDTKTSILAEIEKMMQENEKLRAAYVAAAPPPAPTFPSQEKATVSVSYGKIQTQVNKLPTLSDPISDSIKRKLAPVSCISFFGKQPPDFEDPCEEENWPTVESGMSRLFGDDDDF